MDFCNHLRSILEKAAVMDHEFRHWDEIRFCWSKWQTILQGRRAKRVPQLLAKTGSSLGHPVLRWSVVVKPGASRFSGDDCHILP